jgi:hypothetical protein
MGAVIYAVVFLAGALVGTFVLEKFYACAPAHKPVVRPQTR